MGTTRTTLALIAATTVLLALTSAPAAAADGDGILGGEDPLGGDDPAPGANVTLDLGVGSSQAGGDALVDCTGDAGLDHYCDKRGNMTLGPLDVDYDGYTFGEGDPVATRGGGGDEVTVAVQDRSVTLGFDCVLSLQPEVPCQPRPPDVGGVTPPA